MLDVVVDPPLKLTVAPAIAAPVLAFVTVPLSVPVLPPLDAVKPKFSVVVAPEFTVADCELDLNPLALAVTV